MIDFIREFKFGRPQQVAALLLVAFIGLAVENACRAQLYREALAQDASTAYRGIAKLRLEPILLQNKMAFSDPFNGVIAELSAGSAGSLFLAIHGPLNGYRDSSYPTFVKFVRLPFVVFGVWLAGALWWVTRRLYDNAGGYVALVLFCFSVPILTASSTVQADVIAAWGLYGLIYTAIGVAHTLYAPPRKWIPRIILLGVALGVTASAHIGAAVIGFIFCAVFLPYLAPGRRLVSCAILGFAGLEGLVLDSVLHGFRLGPIFSELYAWKDWNAQIRDIFTLPTHAPQHMLLALLFALSLLVFVIWQRTQYFGNWAPLVVSAAFLAISFRDADTLVWALPFLFTFIGGIFADLLETRRRKLVAWSLGGVLASYAALAVAAVLTIPK